MAAAAGSPMVTVMLIVAMLFFGSYNTINTKLEDQTCAPSLGGSPGTCPVGQKLWAKPWLQNILMFFGEASLLVVYAITRKRPVVSPTDPAGGSSPAGARPQTPFYIFAIPAFCDVFGTGLAAVSMLYLDATIWQMLRSSIIIFSAIVSVTFLKKRLELFHWVAVLIVFCGLVLVCIANSLDTAAAADAGSSGPTAAQSLMGVALVIFAQVCSAFQMCFEELLLTGRAPISAKKVVGCEGAWGILFMTVILFAMHHAPGSDNGRYEDFSEGIHMLANEPSLLFLAVTYMFSIGIYNFVGITVGKRLSAVVRCLVDSCRTVSVWVVNLVLYYGVSEKYGSGWKPHSWMTFLGFSVLVLGTLLYNEVLPPPRCLRRQDGAAAEGADNEGLVSNSFIDGVFAKVDLTDETEGQGTAARECLAPAGSV